MVSLKRARLRSIGDRRITSAGRRHFPVRVTAAPSFRVGASLSLVRKTRARSETFTASIDGRANNFGCGPSSFPPLNQRIQQIPTAGQLPPRTARAWWSGTARPVSFATTSTAKSFGKRTSVKFATNMATPLRQSGQFTFHKTGQFICYQHNV